MTERVEAIRRRDMCTVCLWGRGEHSEVCTVGILLSALAQAEREREFERERVDNQHEAAEMFQNQYREALQERDHSRGLVNGLIAERNDARAEVERLKAAHNELVASREEWIAYTQKAEADLARVRAALDRKHLCVMEACCNDAVRAALEGRG